MSARLSWLDGLRGLAALQVVLLHYTAAFVPAVGLFFNENFTGFWQKLVAETPLFFIINGYFSVYIFFLISGAALTLSYDRAPLALRTAVLRRVVRLGVPMAAAMLFAYVLLTLSPDARFSAAAIIGKPAWLENTAPAIPRLLSALRQIAVEGMLFGYQDSSDLPYRLTIKLGLMPLSESFDPPLWTMHVEFMGSLFVMALVALRALVHRRWYSGICLILVLMLPKSPQVLFLLGHLSAPLLKRTHASSWQRPFGWACLAMGVLLATRHVFGPVQFLFDLWPPSPLPPRQPPFYFQQQLGAIAVFAGVAMLPEIRGVMNGRFVQWLGKISFSLYLTHTPILVTLTCAIFLALHDRLENFSEAVALSSIGGIAVTIVVAEIFNRLFDQTAINLSRRIGASAKRGK